ncbi:transposase ORF-A, IS-type [Legionella israelensis]|uniref:Transposase ORF-A, IS-type n=1 Tax=Legionella israelensis TaxID=454 RepID=A0A0W0VIW3_9GAMM|nr:transposase ORF-A, IS-type [Legionella israelensis]STX61055.1 transposase ORF-A, IS-type [Legionella israelensis]
MKRSRFTENQILNILKSVEVGRLVKDVCREHGISEVLSQKVIFQDKIWIFG